jgi:4-amino-4-deoxy-L-arabinose transferase-like glycosyltransferase
VIRRSGLVLGALLLAAAAAVRFYCLDHFSYGLDEVLQGFWIRGTWDFFWKSLRFDAVHPPLDYLVARSVENLDPAPWARKLPDVLWGVGTVAALGTLVARRAGRAAGLLAALLLAFSPFHVRYSQEFRPYSLALLLACLSLLALDRFLERPGSLRLVLLYLAALATAYTLYLAAVVLALAAVSMLGEDAFSLDADRRRATRKFLAWSPVFVAVLWVAYLPWWPVVLEAMRRPPPVPAEPLTWARLGRTLSFFAFAYTDGETFRWTTAVWSLLMVAGAAIALRQRGLRFLLVWCFGGFLVVELAGYLHPHWYVTRRFLPAGLVFPVLIGLSLWAFARTRARQLAAGVILIGILACDARGLALYFRQGRVDWRPLSRFLAGRPPEEQIFTENQYAQLCVAYYLCGPDWLFREAKGCRPVSNLECEPVRLTWAWPSGQTAWLVLAGEPRCGPLRDWAKPFPAIPFPTAEGAVLHHLDPALREPALGLRR